MSSRRLDCVAIVHRGLLALALALIPGLAPAEGAASSELREEWHKMLIQGKPAGFVHISVRPREGGGYLYVSDQKLAFKRGLIPIETEGSSSLEEAADGSVVGFRLVQKMSRDAMETVGKLEKGALAVMDTVGGKNPRLSRIPLDPGAVGTLRAEQIVKEKLKKPGDEVEVKVFLPELRKYGKQKTVFEKEEVVEIEGKPVPLKRYLVTLDILPGIRTIQWNDSKDELQKSSIALLGMDMVTYRSTAEAILKESFSSPPEIFFATSIPVEGKVHGTAKSMTYRVTSTSGSFGDKPAASLFPGAGEKLLREEGPAVRVLRVERVAPRAGISLPLAPPAGLDEFLRANSFIQSDDKDIAEAARKAVELERDAWKAATTLESFAFKHIEKKDMKTAFATAKEVFTTKSGDCTEHAVLLAALLRAVGIPSRVVAGVVYFDGAFFGHMWTEAHVGEWIPLDATRGLGTVGPDHIALSTSSLDSANIADVFLDIVPVIGSTRLAVLETVE